MLLFPCRRGLAAVLLVEMLVVAAAVLLLSPMCDAASIPEEYVLTSGGYFDQECLHSWGNDVTIKLDGTVVWMGDELEKVEVCPHPMIPFNKTAWVEASPREDKKLKRAQIKSVKYYSGPVAKSTMIHNVPLQFMSTIWEVPPPPPSPFYLNTLFLFNDLQENLPHDAPLRLQPLLQYGNSGCGGGSNSWFITAYLHDTAGRAHCGNMLRVNPGDVIRGNISRSTLDGTDGAYTWTVTTEVNPVDLKAPLTPSEEEASEVAEEGDHEPRHHVLQTGPLMVSLAIELKDHPLHVASTAFETTRLYSCAEYPAGETHFRENVLHDEHAEEMHPIPWKKELHYTECAQGIDIVAGTGDVLIYYNATMESKHPRRSRTSLLRR